MTDMSDACERYYARLADRYWSDYPNPSDVADAELAVFERAYTETPGLIYEAIPEEIEEAEEAAVIAAMIKGDHAEVGRIFSAVARRYALSVYADRVQTLLYPKRDGEL